MSAERTPEPAAARVAVVVAAAGAGWEAQVLERLDRDAARVVLTRRCVDLADLLATASTGSARVAVVSPSLPGLDADSVQALRRAGVEVVLVASPDELLDGDAERLRRLGVEHLLSASELGSLVATVTAVDAESPETAALPLEGGPEAGERDGGRLVAVWGPTGAPGRTTVAVGLAAGLAAAGCDTLLVDADAFGGAVAQHLGVLDEVSGLLAAARAANSGRLDAERLAAAARQVEPGLRVLTGLPRPDRWPEVRARAFGDVLDEVRRAAAYAVVDVGFSLDVDALDPFGQTAPQRSLMTLATLDAADEVVVVGSADPVGLSRLARGLVELRDAAPAARVRVVVNRTRPTLGWSDREIRGMVEGFTRPLGVHFLPDDRAAADRALMAGRSVVGSGDSALATALTGLTSAVGRLSPEAADGRGRLRRRRAGRAR